MKLTTAALLPALGEMREFLVLAVDAVEQNLERGNRPTPDAVANYLTAKMQRWEPKVHGIPMLDDATRQAGARFLAGIACNLLKQQAVRSP